MSVRPGFPRRPPAGEGGMPALALLLALAGMWVMAGLAPATKSAGGASRSPPPAATRICRSF
jgi:hypothetical protein